MKDFQKQYCSKCGKELGVFYYIKIDGMLCKECNDKEYNEVEILISHDTTGIEFKIKEIKDANV
jgi:recombinational DNA repair protein (RecF pathway)